MFERIKIIKGRHYRYLEHRYREGGRVRSKSTYLGPVASVGGAQLDGVFIPGYGTGGFEEQMEQYPEKENAPAQDAEASDEPGDDGSTE